tara:strand:- start:456 stop:794 length:339 start_codon:yes stop_codon:yes gene_type:complete
MTKELIDNSGTGSESAPYSTAVLILGIISIPSCFCYGIIGLTVGIIALILSKKGMKMYEKSPSQYKKTSLNNLKTGRICAIVGISTSLLYILFVILLFASGQASIYSNFSIF